ncbi:MAG TPA: hypothetical protein VGM06_09065 [Polyangiaceae bacterium]
MKPAASVVPFAALSLLVALLVPQCSLTVGLDYLEDGQCPSGTKLCSLHCQAPTPRNGCSAPGCAPCALANATSRCGSSGFCAIAACTGTSQDCNGVADDGCEVDTDHDPNHCGGCTAAPCVVPNATPDCAAGHCAIRSCNSGFDDCNGDALDGCETDLATDANCGQCKNVCAEGTTCQNGACS